LLVSDIKIVIMERVKQVFFTGQIFIIDAKGTENVADEKIFFARNFLRIFLIS